MSDTPTLALPAGVVVKGALQPGFEQILTTEAVAFVADLHRRTDARRHQLLAARVTRQARFEPQYCNHQYG